MVDKGIININLDDIMEDKFGRYSKYIIQERALPDARDGLKPVQRRILYAMSQDGNVSGKPYRKSAKTVGLVIGYYHPHGDSSVYEAMIRMSQTWKTSHPLIDVHGNNGSLDDDPPAAMRYTEARLTSLVDCLITDIDKNTVLMSANFDDTILEPVVLPAGYPNLLVNGSTGIASGYATNIPPHNLNEIIDACVFRINNPTCSLDELLEFVHGPDFPTGGIVQGSQEIKKAFATGKGRIVVRSKVEKNQLRNLQQIVITEIPYEVIKANLVRKIDEIRINKTIDGILDVRDESDRNGLRIVVDIKKDFDLDLALNYLYKNTDLQVYYNYNIVAIVDKRPQQLGLAQLLDAYIFHREEVVIKRTEFLYEKMDARCHILEGLIKATSVMDDIIEIIRNSKDKADSKSNLIEAFNFTETQAEAIVTLRLYRLTATDVVALKDEFASLVSEMENLQAILQNKGILRVTIINELKRVKEEHGRKRLTTIEDQIDEIVIDEIAMITSETLMLTVSADGYLKTVSLRSYQASINSVTGLKEGDQIILQQEVDSLSTLLVFNENGEYGYLPIYKITEGKWKEIGSHISSYIKFDNQSRLVSALVAISFESEAFVTLITQQGMIKRTYLSQFNLTRYNKSSVAMKLKGEDLLKKVIVSYSKDLIHVLSQAGFILSYSSELIAPTSTRGQGIIAINLAKDDAVVDVFVSDGNQSDLVLITDQGLMKRIKIEELSLAARATKGERICRAIKSNPSRLLFGKPGKIYDKLTFINGNKALIVEFKEIPLMKKDASFSKVVELESVWSLIEESTVIKIVESKNNFMTEYQLDLK